MNDQNNNFQQVAPVFQNPPVIPPINQNTTPQPTPASAASDGAPAEQQPSNASPQTPPPQKPIKGYQGSGNNRKKIIATILGLFLLLGGIGAGLLLVGRPQDVRREAAPAGSQEELFGETWPRSQCESAGGTILDFEDAPSLSGSNAPVGTWNTDPYNVTIYSSISPTGQDGPYIARKGSPRESFEGPSNQSCPSTDWNASYRDDQPKSSDAAIMGNYWLTDDGGLNVGGWGFTFEFTDPIIGFGGYVLDTDANEWHIIRYFNENGQEITAALDQIGDRNYLNKNESARCSYDTASDGSAKGFEQGVRQPSSTLISRVEIQYHRIAEDPTYHDYMPPTGTIPGLNNGINWGNPGLGYDFFCIIPAALTASPTQSPAPSPTEEPSPTPTDTPEVGGPSTTPTPTPTVTPIPTVAPTVTPVPTQRVSIPATDTPIPVSGSLTPTIALSIMGIGLVMASIVVTVHETRR